MLIPVAVMGSGEPPILLSQAFSMSAQEIKDSTLTPHVVTPAPGAGKMIVPTMYAFRFTAGATPFNSGQLEVVFGDFNMSRIGAFLDSAIDLVGWVFGPVTEAGFVGAQEADDPADFLNQPLRLRAALYGSIAETATAPTVPGTGYAVGDTGTVDDGNPNATYIVTAEIDGAVGAFTITDGGDGYNLLPGGAPTEWTTTPGGAQPGAGDGDLSIRVESVDASASAGDGTLSGIIYYLVADLA